MSYPRPSARTSTGVLLALLLFSAIGAQAAFASGPGPFPPQTVADPNAVCSPGQLPTQWKDDLHPPATIRVLRSRGPNAGHVETANFWDYVAVVMRAEYSTGADKPPLWMQVGAITVKEYGWYKAMFWGGGRVSTTVDNGDGTTTTTTECYDVKDGTADQIYKPQQTGTDGTVYPGNIPTAPIYRAMAQTWQLSMRKWNATKNVSRLFLTGYRSGKNVACGADTTGFKIYQKSLYDCVNKKLTLEETLRKYFEPVLLVNARAQDSLADSSWWGDLAVLSASGSSTAWNVYPGKVDGFGSAQSGTFSVPFNSIVGYSTGNVDLPDGTNTSATDKTMLADVVMVTGSKVYVARATGNGLADAGSGVDTGVSATKAVFGDFNGDLLMDVGLIHANGDGTSSLWVMTAKGDDTFNPAVQMWTGPYDMTDSTMFVAAGDVNGDGKADLIMRDASGNFQTAVSPASCSPVGAVATSCASGSVGAFALGPMTLALADPGGLGNARFVVGDYDRDGRDDVIAFVGGTSSTVFGMRAKTDGSGFTDKASLWSSSAQNLTNAQPVAMNVDPDGMVDLALVQSASVQWLRTIERSAGPAQMVLASDFPHSGKDTTPPSVPTGFTAVAVAGLTVNVSWNASTDDTGGTVTYRVYRDGRAMGSAAQLGRTYVDHPKAGWHSYSVKAIDAAGNASAATTKVTVKAVN